MRRGSPLQKAPSKPRKALPRLGRKGKEWEATRARLKVRFKRAGIVTCEVRGENCWGANALTFCHTRKRRNIVTTSQLEEVCLGCIECHNALELLPEAEMGRKIKAIIDSRETPV